MAYKRTSKGWIEVDKKGNPVNMNKNALPTSTAQSGYDLANKKQEEKYTQPSGALPEFEVNTGKYKITVPVSEGVAAQYSAAPEGAITYASNSALKVKPVRTLKESLIALKNSQFISKPSEGGEVSLGLKKITQWSTPSELKAKIKGGWYGKAENVPTAFATGGTDVATMPIQDIVGFTTPGNLDRAGIYWNGKKLTLHGLEKEPSLQLTDYYTMKQGLQGYQRTLKSGEKAAYFAGGLVTAPIVYGGIHPKTATTPEKEPIKIATDKNLAVEQGEIDIGDRSFQLRGRAIAGKKGAVYQFQVRELGINNPEIKTYSGYSLTKIQKLMRADLMGDSSFSFSEGTFPIYKYKTLGIYSEGGFEDIGTNLAITVKGRGILSGEPMSYGLARGELTKKGISSSNLIESISTPYQPGTKQIYAGNIKIFGSNQIFSAKPVFNPKDFAITGKGASLGSIGRARTIIKEIEPLFPQDVQITGQEFAATYFGGIATRMTLVSEIPKTLLGIRGFGKDLQFPKSSFTLKTFSKSLPEQGQGGEIIQPEQQTQKPNTPEIYPIPEPPIVIPRIPTPKIPSLPLKPEIPYLPIEFPGYRERPGFKLPRVKLKLKTKYKPSLGGIYFNKKISKIPKEVMGFEIRGIYSPRKKRRKHVSARTRRARKHRRV